MRHELGNTRGMVDSRQQQYQPATKPKRCEIINSANWSVKCRVYGFLFSTFGDIFYSESVVTAYLLVQSEANVNTEMKPKRAIKDSKHGKKKPNAQSKDRAQHKYCKITDCPSQKVIPTEFSVLSLLTVREVEWNITLSH